MTKIGILALQGAFAEHEQVLKALGVETVQIRNRQDWEAHADLGSSFQVASQQLWGNSCMI